MLGNELLFLAFFSVFWLIRRGNPDLWHPVMGGEKPMDLAYLNAIIKSTYFPPYDPWFAGGYLNYYYYGWVIVATLVKLTGIVPTDSLQPGHPHLFCHGGHGRLQRRLQPGARGRGRRRWLPRALRLWSAWGRLLVAVAGQPGRAAACCCKDCSSLGRASQFQSTIPGLAALVKARGGPVALLVKGGKLPFRPEWWYWNASRIMKHGEINEFPFFTFLYADLHAHLTAMPFAMLALGLATSFVVKPGAPH